MGRDASPALLRGEPAGSTQATIERPIRDARPMPLPSHTGAEAFPPSASTSTDPLPEPDDRGE
jgi:hypothetical protein